MKLASPNHEWSMERQEMEAGESVSECMREWSLLSLRMEVLPKAWKTLLMHVLECSITMTSMHATIYNNLIIDRDNCIQTLRIERLTFIFLSNGYIFQI